MNFGILNQKALTSLERSKSFCFLTGVIYSLLIITATAQSQIIETEVITHFQFMHNSGRLNAHSSCFVEEDGSVLVGGIATVDIEPPDRFMDGWWIGKFDWALDTLIWQSFFGRENYMVDDPVIGTIAGEIALVGCEDKYQHRNDTGFVMYLNQNGDSTDGLKFQEITSIIDMCTFQSDSGIAVVSSRGGNTKTLRLVNSEHEITLERHFNPGHYVWLVSMTQLANGDILMGGSDRITPENQSSYSAGRLICYNSVGGEIWRTALTDSIRGGRGYIMPSYALFRDVLELPDGTLLAAGYMNYTNNNSYRMWLAKFSSEGEVIWSRFYNEDQHTSYFTKIRMVNDTTAVLFGFVVDPELVADEQGTYIAVVDSSGNVIVDTILASIGNIADVLQLDNREFLCLYRNFTFVRVNILNENAVVEDKRDAYPKRFALSAFPNPFNSSTTITFATDGTPPPTPPASGGGAPARLAVYDLGGREVVELLNGKMTPPAIAGGDRRTVVWDATEQPAGVYLVRLEAGNRSVTRKVVLMR